MLLAVDMGGTKTKCALFEAGKDSFILRDEEKYESKRVTSLADLIEEYLQKRGLWQSREIESAWIGVAGTCSGSTCTLPNLELTIEMDTVQSRLSFIPQIGWSNDLVALGHGIPLLPEQALLLLNERDSDTAVNGDPFNNKAILALGTGLGESIIIGSNVYPTEGGHADFAPSCAEDLGLWLYLHRIYGHVSYERILSGPGLVNIYNYLITQNNRTGSLSQNLAPHEISAAALAQTCSLCVKALDIFARILGAEAGNLALKSLALGGVYLGGGIPPKIKEKLADGVFRENFSAKGRFSRMVAEIPVYLILEENTPLIGSAALAFRQLRQAC